MRPSFSSILPVLSGAAALAATAVSTHAQTLLGYDGAALFVAEFHGGPDPATCGYPGPPLVGGWVAPPVAGCPTVGLLPPPPAPGVPGDIAFDSATNTVLLSDGFVVASYTAGGAFLGSIFSPLPVFGMGVDSAAGILWCTDGGGLAYGLGLPPAGACGAPGLFVVPPFPVPGPGPLTDIDWDPAGC
jgi:hypothetical protein